MVMAKKKSGNKHEKKVAPAIPNTAENTPNDAPVTPEVVPEIPLENPEIQIQECPADGCQELQDIWNSGGGCYNESSKYCKSCSIDFPLAKEICMKRSIEAQTKVAEKKVAEKKSTPRTSSAIKEGFGHRAGTQAAGIDAILQEGGGTPEQILQKLVADGYNRNSLTMDDLWRRTLTHFSDLKRNHGLKITKANGIYTVQQ
jgi:hypothetical protein